MKIYMMKLKKELRITIDGSKQDLKKGHEIMAFTLAEYAKFAPYANTKIVTVDDKKFLNLVKTNLKKIDGTEVDLSSSIPGQDEADERLKKEYARREALKAEQEEDSEDEDEDEDDKEDEDDTTDSEDEETEPKITGEDNATVDPFSDEKPNT